MFRPPHGRRANGDKRWQEMLFSSCCPNPVDENCPLFPQEVSEMLPSLSRLLPLSRFSSQSNQLQLSARHELTIAERGVGSVCLANR